MTTLLEIWVARSALDIAEDGEVPAPFLVTIDSSKKVDHLKKEIVRELLSTMDIKSKGQLSIFTIVNGAAVLLAHGRPVVECTEGNSGSNPLIFSTKNVLPSKLCEVCFM
jgi:hypothetical protein